MDLLSSSLLGRNGGNPSKEGATLLGVSKVLAMEDLEFSILLDKSDNGDSIVGERSSEGSGTDARGLCHS